MKKIIIVLVLSCNGLIFASGAKPAETCKANTFLLNIHIYGSSSPKNATNPETFIVTHQDTVGTLKQRISADSQKILGRAVAANCLKIVSKAPGKSYTLSVMADETPIVKLNPHSILCHVLH